MTLRKKLKLRNLLREIATDLGCLLLLFGIFVLPEMINIWIWGN